MSNSSDKQPTTQSADNTLRYAFNDADKTLAVGSFVTSKIGHKIVMTQVSSTIEDYEYFDGSTSLQIVRVTYTDNTKSTLVSVERTS